ncbi:MAG: spiro-SPASM protein, partial [Treponemataceae bacterium]|nr:spiro-SPASM protein [Treponemataceae bacterium]
YNNSLVYAQYRQLTAARALDDMAFADFQSLVAQMAALSETAVVSLSAFGEPLLHPRFADCVREVLSYPGLSVFIETDGTLVTESLAADLARLGARRIVWVVLLDAAESSLYARLHQCDAGDFSRAVAAVGLLERHFPHRVYPQMTRMKANEPQLEQFYRHWKDKDSASAGELIIQKYNCFCGALPDEQSADLSPLERMPCWHLRRDLTILSDGSVPLCVSQATGAAVGNALTEGIAAVWERFAGPLAAQIGKDYPAACETCDEFYTFNF